MTLAALIDSRRDQHLAELKEFLGIPSVSAKSEHKPDIERAARWVADHLSSAGFPTVEIVPTSLHPLVYAESLNAPGKPTILFYGHYDVQPAEPLHLWTTPPFEPAIRNGNIYGRGTADDKGQVHIHLKALQSLQEFAGKFLERLQRLQMNVDLALIVGGAAAVNVAVANGGFEGRSGPKMKRFGRLDVIVAVKEDGGLARCVEGFGIDQRVQRGGHDFHGRETGRAQVVGDPTCGALDVRLVLGFSADAGDTKKLLQFDEMLITA